MGKPIIEETFSVEELLLKRESGEIAEKKIGSRSECNRFAKCY